MQQVNQQQKIMQQLNAFLKNFKNTVNTKLRIIQSLLSGNGQITYQSLLSKISLKQIIDHSSYLDTNIIITTGDISKLVYRFCLRINQFLQYRLCELKNREEVFFKNQVNIFQRNINNIFKQLNKQPELKIILKQILVVQNNFSYRLLQKISQNFNSLFLSLSLSKNNQNITKQSLFEVAKIFKEKFSINSNHQSQIKKLKNQSYSSQIHSHSTIYENSQSTGLMNKLYKKEKNKKNKSIRENYTSSFDQWDGILPALPSTGKNLFLEGSIHINNNNNLLPYNPQAEKSMHYHQGQIRRHTLQRQHNSLRNIRPESQLNGCLTTNGLKLNIYDSNKNYFTQSSQFDIKSKKQQYLKAISSIMEIDQHPFGSYSNDYIMQQLVILNKKNQTMIHKFLKRYNRKKFKSEKNLFKIQHLNINLSNHNIQSQKSFSSKKGLMTLNNINVNINTNERNSVNKVINDKKSKKLQDQILLQTNIIVDLKKKRLPTLQKKSSYIVK